MIDERNYEVATLGIDALFALLADDFPGIPCHHRDHVGFRPEYVEWIRRGTKKCTIRYRSGEVDAPSAVILPMRETKPEDPNWRQDVGLLQVDRLVVKRFGLLSDEDCIWDGFRGAHEVRRALEKVYGPIDTAEYVSLYWFSIRSWAGTSPT